MSQCIRERPKRSIFLNRTSNTVSQGLNRQYHDGGADAPWQLHAPRRTALTVGTKRRSNRSLDRAVLPRLSKGLSLEGHASRAPEARRAAQRGGTASSESNGGVTWAFNDLLGAGSWCARATRRPRALVLRHFTLRSPFARFCRHHRRSFRPPSAKATLRAKRVLRRKCPRFNIR